MTDLISRQAAIDAFQKELCGEHVYATPFVSLKGCERILNELPSAERRGRWIKHPWGGGVHTCSVCGKRADVIVKNGYLTGDASPSGETGGYYHYDRCELLSNYCPYCGARMDGGENG